MKKTSAILKISLFAVSIAIVTSCSENRSADQQNKDSAVIPVPDTQVKAPVLELPKAEPISVNLVKVIEKFDEGKPFSYGIFKLQNNSSGELVLHGWKNDDGFEYGGDELSLQIEKVGKSDGAKTWTDELPDAGSTIMPPDKLIIPAGAENTFYTLLQPYLWSDFPATTRFRFCIKVEQSFCSTPFTVKPIGGSS